MLVISFASVWLLTQDSTLDPPYTVNADIGVVYRKHPLREGAYLRIH